MSVIQVLEKYERKHGSLPGDDKAGWKRLIHGAMSKAAGLFWTAGGAVDVTIGPPISHSPDTITNTVKFTEIRSPVKNNDSYLSVSIESETSELYLSLEEANGIIISSPNEKLNLIPKSHSTPYKDKPKSTVKFISKGLESPKKPPKKLTSGFPLNVENVQIKDDKSAGPSYPEMSELCSEMERLSLKKMITQVEKTITDEIRNEFDEVRKKMEEHDQQVEDLLAREAEEKEVEQELTEMNWFQKIREKQLKVERDFNKDLEAVLAKAKKIESVKKSAYLNSKIQSDSSAEQKIKEMELVARKRALIETISSTQKSYNAKYNEMLQLLQSSSVSLVSEFHSDFDTLKKNNVRLTDVISKSKCGNISQADVDECNTLFSFLLDLYYRINLRNEDYENTKRLEEEANAKLLEALRKNEENSKKQPVEVMEANVKSGMEKKEGFISSSSTETNKRRLERLKYCNYVLNVLTKAEESLEPFLNDDKYKNFRKDCQRAVNVPVNAISPTSAQHLKDKLDKLTDLLDGKSVPVMNRRFSAKDHPLGIRYCEVLLARKVVKAGEDVVSSHPETGHAIATVVLALIMRYPVLSVYIQAFFFRICPYLVPLDLKPSPTESDIEYNKRLGFNYDNREREETDKFLKRMSGVAQLYSAVLIAHKRRSDSSLCPPLGVSELWVWLTNFISLDPLSDVSATILLDVLEVSGHSLLSSYGFNFQKLLYLICTDYLCKIYKVTEKGRGGPVERLKTFLEDVIKDKKIPPPRGILSHFW